MSEPIFEKGLIKVVWVGEDPKRIESKMFDTVEAAEKFAQTKQDYITFKLLKQTNLTDFEWEILPLGRHQIYETLLKNYKKHRAKILALSSSKIGSLLAKFI